MKIKLEITKPKIFGEWIIKRQFVELSVSQDISPTLSAPWEICVQVKKQQLEPDVEQQTGSKLGKEYVKAVYCLPAYLTYMQSTSWELLG